MGARELNGELEVDVVPVQPPPNVVPIIQPPIQPPPDLPSDLPPRLQQISLRCFCLKDTDGFEEVVAIPVEWTWNRVLSWLLIYLFSCTMLVLVSFMLSVSHRQCRTLSVLASF